MFIWTFAVPAVLNELLNWLYAQIVGFPRWISSAAAAPVRTYPWPERAGAFPVNAPAFLWNRSASRRR